MGDMNKKRQAHKETLDYVSRIQGQIETLKTYVATEPNYRCSVCKLTYKSKVWAQKCEKWCISHQSCNLKITAHSLQVQN